MAETPTKERVRLSRERKRGGGITRVEVQVYADQAEAVRAYAAKLREERQQAETA